MLSAKELKRIFVEIYSRSAKSYNFKVDLTMSLFKCTIYQRICEVKEKVNTINIRDLSVDSRFTRNKSPLQTKVTLTTYELSFMLRLQIT